MSEPTFLLLYATRHGQAKKVAERIVRTLAVDGVVGDLCNAAQVPANLDLTRYQAAILIASVHLGKHEPEMVAFARAHRERLAAMPSALISVSLSEATLEDTRRPAKAREEARISVCKAFDDFGAATGWLPRTTLPLAGALRYSQYGLITRLVMRMIARHTGADTDTSRDYEYTDWAALDRFAAGFAHTAERGVP